MGFWALSVCLYPVSLSFLFVSSTWRRRRRKIWKKGEESENSIGLARLVADSFIHYTLWFLFSIRVLFLPKLYRVGGLQIKYKWDWDWDRDRDEMRWEERVGIIIINLLLLLLILQPRRTSLCWFARGFLELLSSQICSGHLLLLPHPPFTIPYHHLFNNILTP